MNNQEAAEEQRTTLASEQRFNDRLAEAEASIAHLRHCARLQDSATAAVLERAEKAEAELAACRQEAELAACRQDAERYRWLRDGDVVCGTDFPAAKDKAGNSLWLQELDAAIDAARGVA